VKPNKLKNEYHTGDLGGRGCHPSDPTGEIYGNNHWPLPLPHELGDNMASKFEMRAVRYLVLDITIPEQTKLLKVAGLRASEQWGLIYKAEGRKIYAPPLEGRSFSKLDKLTLQYLYWNTFQKTPPEEYDQLIQAIAFEMAMLPSDDTELTELEAQVTQLYPDGYSGNSPAKPPKEIRQKTISDRPAGTTTTGLVWVIADQVWEKHGKVIDKELRTLIIEACTKEEINPSTAATQFAKWKGSK
jgi:hypothetical protein